jgi:hypothetical protein
VPLFLSLSGGSIFLARFLNCLAGALTCIPLFLFTSRLSSPGVGLVAAAMLSVYPEHLYWAMHFTPESSGGLVLMSALAIPGSRNVKQEFLRGVLFGLAALITPRNLIVVAVYLFFRIIAQLRSSMKKPNLRHAVARNISACLLAGAAFLLTIAPWSFRNYLVSGRFIPVSAHGGLGLVVGNNTLVESNPALRGGYYTGRLADLKRFAAILKLPEAERDRAFRERAVEFYRSLSLSQLIRLELAKIGRFLTPFSDTPNQAYNLLTGLAWALLAPLVLLGLARANYAQLAVVTAYLLIALIFFGEQRYRASISPILISIAALGLSTISQRLIPAAVNLPGRRVEDRNGASEKIDKI